VANQKVRSRGWDAYGNDIFDSWDGSELDHAEANARLYLNRFTNVMAAVSIQPAYGGPLYAIRNVALNASEEQISSNPRGHYEPSGALILHNTFVSPIRALKFPTTITQHNFAIENNLFVGPARLTVPELLTGMRQSMRVGLTTTATSRRWVLLQERRWRRRPLPELFRCASDLFEQHGVLLTTPVFARASWVGRQSNRLRRRTSRRRKLQCHRSRQTSRASTRTSRERGQTWVPRARLPTPALRAASAGSGAIRGGHRLPRP
jgi:hypothetical protein